MYIQITYLEDKKAFPNNVFIKELVENAALEGQGPIENLVFSTEKEGWDYIKLMNHDFQIAKNIYEQTKKELDNQ